MKVNPSLCVLCRGRGLCDLAYCPIIARARAFTRLSRVRLSNIIEGSTPPAVFVGRMGYPYVRAGPSTPPILGDTSIFDYPEKWSSLRVEDILEYRWSLVTGYRVYNVKRVEDRFLEEVRLLVLSDKPVDVQAVFEKPPRPVITFNEHEPPQGPRAPLSSFRVIGNPSIPRPLEKAYYDTDLPAAEAVASLYETGIPVSHIQKAFSLGSFGLKGQRKLVPTRWSITAVDNMICRHILREVKGYKPINEVMVFEHEIHDNLFIGVLYPAKWSYEWMEAWWPGSTWNPVGLNVVVEGDYEDYLGRTTYPGIGGCYYASMLATLEYLKYVKRQATAVLIREIYPGFNLPIGVWFVRESCREMFKKGPAMKADSLREVCDYLDRVTKLGCKKWFSSSRLLRRILSTRKIEEYFKRLE
ncbi:MAG: Nre family DNA repair protein [Desulfurococcaceae archaeon]